MALQQINSTVGTVPIRLLTLPTGSKTTAVQISNGHSSSIYLGGSSVATSGANHGVVLAAGANIQIWLNPGDSLYAIASVASGTGDIVCVFSA